MPWAVRCTSLLGVLLLSGCFNWQNVEAMKPRVQSPLTTGPIGPDAVALEYAILDLPAGDRVANLDAWKLADELVLGVDTRAVLEQNGFRVGVVMGNLPEELQAILHQPRHEQSIRRRQTIAAEVTKLSIHSQIAASTIKLCSSAEANPPEVQLPKGTASLAITPFRESDGRIRVQVVPELISEEKRSWIPGAAGTAWSKENAAEVFSQFSFELTLRAGEYVIVGASIEKEQTLGDRFFFCSDRDKKRQKLLIFRAYPMDGRNAGTMNDAPGRSLESMVNAPR